MAIYEGTITKIRFFPLSEKVKNFTTKDGKQYNKDKTHRVSIQVEGEQDWFNAGNIKCVDENRPTWRKQINGEWQDIREGAEVQFAYDVNDKGYKNIKLKTLEINKNGDGQATPESQGNQGESQTPQNNQTKQEPVRETVHTSVQNNYNNVCFGFDCYLLHVEYDMNTLSDKEAVGVICGDFETMREELIKYTRETQPMDYIDASFVVEKNIKNSIRLCEPNDPLDKIKTVAKKLIKTFILKG